MTGSEGRHGRIPEFFVVGHAKSGTTALFDALYRHPQIFMPQNKEPWFLSEEIKMAAEPRPPGTGWTPATLEDYLALFAGAEPHQRTGEASAVYLWSRTAAGQIAELQPRAKIVAILREPASFLRSLHMQLVQVYVEREKDLRKALELESQRRERRDGFDSYWPRATMYSEWLTYTSQLRRYHQHFPRERVLVLIYDDYRRDNQSTLRRLQRFLEVDDTVAVKARDANPTVRVRSRRLHELVHSIAVGRGPVARAVRGSATALAPRGISRESAIAIRNRLFFSEPEPPDEQLMLEIRRRYRTEVEELSEYLDRDLVSLWGYDRLS
jgi:Sulfotransferase family